MSKSNGKTSGLPPELADLFPAGAEIARVALDDLLPDPMNPRRHPEKNLRGISDSLRDHGQVEFLVVQKSTRRIIGGHGRVEAMRALGRTHCAAVLLVALGEDPARDGLRDTPRRFADLWREFVEHDPGRLDTAFASEATDQMVAVSGMRVWSVCEHHLIPFWADVSVGYIARGRVLGLSKFARVAHAAAHRLQVQERLSQDIADAVGNLTGSPDVAVLARGEHLCMTMRGVRTPALMTTSVMRGVFRDDPSTRAEFLRLAGA